MLVKFNNDAITTLASDITSTDTTIPVITGAGAIFSITPTIIRIDDELILIASRSGDDLIVATNGRGYEGTTATSHTSGSIIRGTITAGGLNEVVNNAINNRLYSTTSTASLTPDIDNYGVFKITALDEDITINNPTSNANFFNPYYIFPDAQMIMFIIKDDGTSRTISWGSNYADGCSTRPTSTSAGKWVWILFQWSSADSKWYCISVGTQS